MSRIWVAVLVLIAAIILSSTSVFAHSYLDDTDPPLGSVLDESPEQLVLYFSQSIDSSFGYFRLVNKQGDVLREFSPLFADNNEVVTLALETPLENGRYRIAWEIMSAVDGHVSSGIVPFAIGVQSESLAEFNLEGTAEAPSTTRIIVRWLSYLAMLVLVGSLFFTLLLSRPIGHKSGHAAQYAALIWASLGAFVIAEIFDVMMQASTVSASFSQVLLESKWGMARLGRLLFAGSIGLLGLLSVNDPVRLWASRAAGLLMIVTHASASHNAGLIGDVGFALDAVHLLAAALWLGGLVQLALIWLPRGRAKSAQERVERLVPVISRFSNMALSSVLMLLGSGIYTAFFHIPNWGALVGSLYGQALIMKMALLLVVMGIAFANRFHFVPRILAYARYASKNLSESTDDIIEMLSRFRRLVTTEALAVIVILLFAGVMTTASPPHEQGMHSTAEPIVLSRHLEEALVELTVMPLRDGERVIDVRAVNHDGAPLEGVLRVWLEMTYLEEDLGGVVIDPIAEPTERPGVYQLSGPYLNLEGGWQIEVFVRISGRADDMTTSFEFETSQQ